MTSSSLLHFPPRPRVICTTPRPRVIFGFQLFPCLYTSFWGVVKSWVGFVFHCDLLIRQLSREVHRHRCFSRLKTGLIRLRRTITGSFSPSHGKVRIYNKRIWDDRICMTDDRLFCNFLYVFSFFSVGWQPLFSQLFWFEHLLGVQL